MQKFPKPKKPKPPNEPAEDYFAEEDLRFENVISELANRLEWKKTTVAGFIFQALQVFDWRGHTPLEIAETHLAWQNHFWKTRAQRREGFLRNIFREGK